MLLRGDINSTHVQAMTIYHFTNGREI